MKSSQDDEIKLIRLRKIAEQIQTKKKLQITNINGGNGSYGDIMFVNDGFYDYAIKILSIYDGVDSICQKQLQKAKEEAKKIIEIYHSEFQLGNNYIIMMEKCEKSLQKYIDENKQNPIDKKTFVRIALEILKGVQYLHEKSYVLRDLTLSNILLDQNFTIKLCDFGLAKKIGSSQVGEALLSSQQRGALFYYPPELLNLLQNNSQKVIQNREGDIWALGVCLYALAGASFTHILFFAQGSQSFQNQQYLGEEINQAIKYILNRDPNQRPKIEQIIQCFQNIFDFNILESSNSQQDLIQDRLANTTSQDQQHLVEKNNISVQKTIPLSQELDLLNEGLQYQKKQMYKEATISFINCLEKNPENEQAYYYLAGAYYYQSNIKEAILNYNKSIQINPKFHLAHYNLGVIYEKLNKFENAINCYKQTIIVNPKYSFAHYSLGNIYYAQLKYQDAANCYKNAIEINPKLDQAYNNLGNVNKKLGDLNQAKLFYQKAVDIKPTNGNAQNNLGRILQKQGQYSLSLEHFEKAAQLKPNNLQYQKDLLQIKKAIEF